MAEEKKKQTVMVGDRKFDVEGAKAFGLASVGVSYGYAERGELKVAGADYIVSNVKKLGDVLLQEHLFFLYFLLHFLHF